MSTRQDNPPSPFAQDVRLALRVAAGFAAIAAVPLVLLVLRALIHVFRNGSPIRELGDWTVTAVVVLISYLVIAAVAGPLYAILRPIRATSWGSVISGALLTPIIFGGFGLIMILCWEPAGRLLFGDAQTGRGDLVQITRAIAIGSAFTGLFVGPIVRTKLGSVAQAG